MAVRQTLIIGDPKLKKVCQAITDFDDPALHHLIQDLKDTMESYKLIGIAAPQIGENFQVFITEPRETPDRPKGQSDELRVYINPQIVEQSEEEIVIYEGCGCMPDASIFGPVTRPRWVKVEAQDENGQRFSFKADGILGRVIQHEYDHLQGIEFIQKVEDNGKILSAQHYREQIKSQDWHKANSRITIKEHRSVQPSK